MSNELSGKDKMEIAVESGLQLVPVVGAALSSLYFSTKNEKRFKRIESFYEEFSQLITELRIDLNPLNPEYEPLLISLIERLNDKIERETLESKRSYFKNYLLSTLQDQVKEHYDKQIFFLETIDSLTSLDFDVLSLLSKKPAQTYKVGDIRQPGVDQYAIVGSVGKLKNLGFIKAFTLSMTIGGGVDNALSESVQITNYGMHFIRFCLK